MEIKANHGEGSHLTIDIKDCNKKILENEKKIKQFLQEIAESIEMHIISEIKVLKHTAENPLDSGITGFVIISESHISIHTYPERNFASIDIFSCKEFDYNKATEFVKEFFQSKTIQRNLLNRGIKENFDVESHCKTIKGFDLDLNMTALQLLDNFETIGFQASHLNQAKTILKKMRENNATIFMSFTSNMVSSGLRELFAQIVKEKLVDVIITSVGSVEEDLMKSKNKFLLGDFNSNDIDLHKKGINRIGNIFVPDKNYEDLEDQLTPIFQKIYETQKTTGAIITPSKLINEVAKTIKDKNSFLYWANKNEIPVYCPAITDGALGLQLFFFNQKNKLMIDTAGDMKELSQHVLNAEKTAGIILGGGFAKHHLIGINILREGLDYAIYMTTATEGDGSLSGARPKEAKSWSKIKEDANNVCVEGDVTITFPILALAMKKELSGRK